MIAQITLSGCPKYPAGERGLKDRSRGCKTPKALPKSDPHKVPHRGAT